MVRYWAHNPGTDNASTSSTLVPATKRSACTDRGLWKVRYSIVLEKLVLFSVSKVSAGASTVIGFDSPCVTQFRDTNSNAFLL